jgi:RNA 3'-terminal phosphate cyclase (ATP)
LPTAPFIFPINTNTVDHKTSIMITIDGSTLEGGGQLVRVALSISSIYHIPVRISNIRANRSSHSRSHQPKSRTGGSGREKRPNNSSSVTAGGLKESHLAALNWLAQKCDAVVDGGEVGSQEVVFKPRRRQVARQLLSGNTSSSDVNGEIIELQKPGSVWLIWQAIFPYIVSKLLLQPKAGSETTESASHSSYRITLKGGTNVPKSPSSEYVQQVFIPVCAKFGLPQVTIKVNRRGWAGNDPEIGEVDITVDPSPTTTTFSIPPPYHHHRERRGDVTKIEMTLLAGSQETYDLLETTIPTTLLNLNNNESQPAIFPPTIPITTHPSSTAHTGSERRLYILLVAHTTHGHRLGRDILSPARKMTSASDRRTTVSTLVDTVVGDLLRELAHGRCLDEYAEDQVVIFEALARYDRKAWAGLVADADADAVAVGTRKLKADKGSLHTRTVRWVCEEMLGAGVVAGDDDDDGTSGLEDLLVQGSPTCSGVKKVERMLETLDI